MDVAIVGLGMHPFGRTPSMSGLEQGAAAARAGGVYSMCAGAESRVE
mgnify:CR=1 FL=1